MSFGTPGKHGKFYAGRNDDTPVNHDLLWRRRVASEVELLKEQEAHQAANNRHWSHRETDMLVEAYKRHGVANFESIKRDPKYTQLVTARGRAGLHNKWKELTAGGLDLQDILEARERQSTQRTGRSRADASGGLGKELKLRERLKRHQQRTARREDELARQRRKRFAAEKRAAAELRRANALRDALETLEREVYAAPGTMKSSGGHGTRSLRRHNTRPEYEAASPSHGNPSSPLRAGGAHMMSNSSLRASGKIKHSSRVVPSPTIATVPSGTVFPQHSAMSKVQRQREQQRAARHAQAISYLVT